MINAIKSGEIYVGDCQKVSRKAGDLVITDPPYNCGYKYDIYGDQLADGDWLDILADVCAPPSVIILYPVDMFKLAYRMGELPTKIVAWVYPANTPRQHRLIAWFGCCPDMGQISQPYKNPTDKRIAKRIREGHAARSYDWWEIPQVKNVSREKTAHPCQIPLEVMLRIVKVTPGRRIYDPFAGSGTTLRAAQIEEREYCGAEISPTYAHLIRQRLRQPIQTLLPIALDD